MYLTFTKVTSQTTI